MRIVRVLGNVKAGCDVEVGAKTLIVGPNGSGKSSVVNTVELALTGRASDIAGRVDIGREVDVMSLATGPELEALAVFDDGVNAAYRTSGSTAKAKKATGDKPSDRCHEDVLPIRSLREALLGAPATARKYLLGKVSDGVTFDAAKAMIDPSVHEMFDSIIAASPGGKPADVLIDALEKAGAQAREATASAKAAKAAAAFVTGGAAVPPTNEQIAALQTAARGFQDEYVGIVAAVSRATDLPLMQEELAKTEETAVAAVEAYQAAKARLDQLGKPPESPNANFDVAFNAAKESVNRGECIVCGNTALDDIREVVGTAETMMEVYISAKATYDHAKKEEASYKREAERAVSAFERAEERVKDTERLVNGGVPHRSAEEVKALYEAALEEVEDAKAKRSAWDTAYRAQAQAVAAETASSQWATLKVGLTTAVEKLVDGALKGFIAKVQASLPDTDTFDMRLRDGSREVVQFGLVRNGQLHTALSGAEWARVMAAMASACVPEGAYACIIPEERAFDAVTLANVMTALAANPHQVILTSPVAPKSVPKGWTVIKRGDA